MTKVIWKIISAKFDVWLEWMDGWMDHNVSWGQELNVTETAVCDIKQFFDVTNIAFFISIILYCNFF